MIGNSFHEIFETMRLRMSELYAGKKDNYYQDPGETMVELYSLLLHMQQDYMDYIGDEHYLMYLLLLGEDSRQDLYDTMMISIDSSSSYIKCFEKPYYGGKIIVLPQGYLFEGEGLKEFDTVQITDNCIEYKKTYETASQATISLNRLIAVSSLDKLVTVSSLDKFKTTSSVKEEYGVVLGFQEDISICPIGRIYVEVEQKTDLPKAFIPLGTLQGEYLDSSGLWKTLTQFEDNTGCFMKSGYIDIHTEPPMFKDNYKIRFIIKENNYEILPVIINIKLNVVKVLQIKTLCETKFLMRGRKDLLEYNDLDKNKSVEQYQLIDDNCFILLENKLDRLDIIENEVALSSFLTVTYKKGYQDKFSFNVDGIPNQKIPLNIPDMDPDSIKILVEYKDDREISKWKFWHRVENFYESLPNDEHFVVRDGALCFGNHKNGGIPNGRIKLVGCKCSASAIRRKKSVSDRMKNVKDEFYKLHKAVTLADYKNIVQNINFLALDQTDVTMNETTGAIIVIAKPKSENPFPILNEKYKQNMLRYLEPYRMITTELVVESVVYCGLHLYIEVQLQKNLKDAEEKTKQGILEYFPSEDFAKRKQRPFGEMIEHSEVYHILYNMKWVLGIKSFRMDCENACITSNGCIKLPYNGLVYIKKIFITNRG